MDCTHGNDRRMKLKNLFEQKDYHTYTIHVHALKSTAYNIGAMELGDEAKAQEIAGKNQNYQYIEEHFELLMEEYQIVLLEIEKWFLLEKQTVSPTVESEDLVESGNPVQEVILQEDKENTLAVIRKKMDEFDFDSAREILVELLPLLEDGEEKERLADVGKAIEEFDIERAMAGIKENADSQSK